ncbi:MAG: hypothetical protein LBO04_04570 [Spirochaetaceae bacterium]|nr:hypothetical protein [Spirochaetaceae bacterium]
MPQLTGTQDFSSPKTFAVRASDGTTSKYTVTVYALFSGKESLAGLAAYTDWTGGKAAEPDPARPLYIALEGMDFYNDNIPSIEPVGVFGTQPAGASFLRGFLAWKKPMSMTRCPATPTTSISRWTCPAARIRFCGAIRCPWVHTEAPPAPPTTRTDLSRG